MSNPLYQRLPRDVVAFLAPLASQERGPSETRGRIWAKGGHAFATDGHTIRRADVWPDGAGLFTPAGYRVAHEVVWGPPHVAGFFDTGNILEVPAHTRTDVDVLRVRTSIADATVAASKLRGEGLDLASDWGARGFQLHVGVYARRGVCVVSGWTITHPNGWASFVTGEASLHVWHDEDPA